MSSTPLTKKDICRLWGVRASYIDAKIEEILTIVERDIDEQYLLTKLNQYGMEIQDVIIDITSVSKSNSPNTNHNNNHNTNNNNTNNNNNNPESDSDSDSSEIITTLHQYPMIGPYSR
eukprot:233545_1